MEDKKTFFDLDYDDLKSIRILPSNISYGKTMQYYTYSHGYYLDKFDLRKNKIKNILNAIDI